MRHRVLIVWCAGLLVAGGLATDALAQGPAPENLRDALVAHWTQAGQKVVQLAEEFPPEKYDFKPVDGVRTFADQLRHVAFWNTFVAKSARGEKADGGMNELPKAEYGTKARIVEALRRSLDEATAALKQQPTTPPTKIADLFTAFIGHTGEHYGQLVVYFRLNGLVPPASRGQ
jgi:hypothetical protein